MADRIIVVGSGVSGKELTCWLEDCAAAGTLPEWAALSSKIRPNCPPLDSGSVVFRITRQGRVTCSPLEFDISENPVSWA